MIYYSNRQKKEAPMDIKDLEKNFNKLVGRRVREYRIIKDVSQEELGKYLNLPKQAISSIEKGKRRVTAQELDKISLFFDEPLSAFVKEEHKYVYPVDTPYGALPVYIADFLEEYRYSIENVDMYEKEGKRLTDKLIDAIKAIYSEVKNNKK